MRANLGSQYGTADANAVITIRFPKALAVLEATWTCVDHGVANGPLLYGTSGTLVMDIYHDNTSVKLSRGKDDSGEVIKGDPLPQGRDTLAKEFIHHLETGEPLHETLRPGFNLDAEAILDAGIRSSETGRLELVNDAGWCVG